MLIHSKEPEICTNFSLGTRSKLSLTPISRRKCRYYGYLGPGHELRGVTASSRVIQVLCAECWT